jgi:hypothetical protein
MVISSTPAARESDLQRALDGAVNKYREDGDRAEQLHALAAMVDGRSGDELAAAAEPYRQIPEVAGPIYERVVAEQPENAHALVILANAYWLGGGGPEMVGELASRAIAADATNRGAWHLWSLSEGDPRARIARWNQVVDRFPEDDLARANLADNLASVAGGEHDMEALEGAIKQFEILLAKAVHPDQRLQVSKALEVLRAWKV